jgi:hypothetical protein
MNERGSRSEGFIKSERMNKMRSKRERMNKKRELKSGCKKDEGFSFSKQAQDEKIDMR